MPTSKRSKIQIPEGDRGLKAASDLDFQNLGQQIVAVDNGFVFEGQTMVHGDWVEMIHGSNVRRYGTTKGLPQLAAEGAQKETQLDEIKGLLQFPLGRLVFVMECNREVWAKPGLPNDLSMLATMKRAALTPNLGRQIVAVDNGFVFVGQTIVNEDWVEMYDSANVRRYGTTKGLPQLASEGPQKETQLDPIAGLLKFPLGRLVFFMQCDDKQWAKKSTE